MAEKVKHWWNKKDWEEKATLQFQAGLVGVLAFWLLLICWILHDLRGVIHG